MMDTIRTKLDDRGVSPVIGVILMVAITVILAAVIGSFVLGLGENVSEPAQASIGFEAGENASDSNNNAVLVNHNGGDTLEDATLTVRTGGSSYKTTITSLAPGETINKSSSSAFDPSSPSFNDDESYDVIITQDDQTVAQGTVEF